MNDDHHNDADGLVELGTEFTIRLKPLLFLREPLGYSAEDLVRAMSEENTTLTELTIDCGFYEPSGQVDEVLFLQFLQQYISSSRNHHLRTLKLKGSNFGHEAIIRRFFIAAAQSETVHHLKLCSMYHVPVQALADFCRTNRNIKVLEIRMVLFAFNEDALEHNTSTTTTLDKLVLDHVLVEHGAAAIAFADVVSRLKITHLVLGCVHPFSDGDEDIAPRVISGLIKNSPVNLLEVLQFCSIENFSTALMAGKDSVEELLVEFGVQEDWKKFDSLVRILSEMVQLKVLRVTLGVRQAQAQLHREAKIRFFRAIDACAALTDIDVIDIGNTGNNFSQDQIHQIHLLQDGRTERNRNLHSFVANPSEYPGRELLKLMLQLENCPNGRLQLVRALPQDFFKGSK